MRIPILDETELRRQTQIIYDQGGLLGVLACIDEMQQCEIIILTKLNEILKEVEESEEVR